LEGLMFANNQKFAGDKLEEEKINMYRNLDFLP
jgi:hypothetical protein